VPQLRRAKRLRISLWRRGPAKTFSPEAAAEAFVTYALYKRNVAGVQWEWWYHRGGCGEWFKANRNTLTNEVHQTLLPQDEEQRG
jgi:heterotetrameric sarcosine oxidase delta subunit